MDVWKLEIAERTDHFWFRVDISCMTSQESTDFDVNNLILSKTGMSKRTAFDSFTVDQIITNIGKKTATPLLDPELHLQKINYRGEKLLLKGFQIEFSEKRK